MIPTLDPFDHRRRAHLPKPLMSLTTREAEVLGWIAEGKRDGEIAEILEASVRTIHKHAQRIYKKLGVETRTAAAILAREAGLQPPEVRR